MDNFSDELKSQDFLTPETPVGEDPALFSASEKREQFLAGTSQSQSNSREKPFSLPSWDIALGKGLEVAKQLGWEKFRAQLDSMSWDPLAETQISQIKTLQEKAKSEPVVDIREDGLAYRNRAAIRKYVQETREKYPRNDDSPYFALPDETKKLTIGGKDCPDFGKEKTTRVYMALNEIGLRYGFEALREALADNGALKKMILVMNLEVLHNEDPNTVDNNAIVMYVPDSNPETLTKIVHGIKTAKEKMPRAFQLSSAQLADVKTHNTAEFMIPLDDTTGFVEVEASEGSQSYHTRAFADIRTGVYRGLPAVENGLPNINAYNETVKSYRPEVRNIAKIANSSGKIIQRRLTMPGLVAA